jgi:hypothetical protein
LQIILYDINAKALKNAYTCSIKLLTDEKRIILPITLLLLKGTIQSQTKAMPTKDDYHF